MRLITTLRLLAALIVTWGLLPYAWGYTLVNPMVLGQIDQRWALILGGGILAVFALTWRLRPSLGNHWWPRWTFPAVLAGWLVACGIIIAISVIPTRGMWAMVLLFLFAGLWAPWTAWLGFTGAPSIAKWFTLVVLAPMAVAFPYLYRIEGMDGDTRIEFALRSIPRRDGRAARTETPTVPPLGLTEIGPDDSPQFFGPTRSGRFSARITDWAGDKKPRELWRREVGAGWSSFAAVGGYAVTQEQIGPDECVSCYRMDDGALVWRYAHPARFESVLGGDGPRATPAIADGMVYAVGAAGHLVCLAGGAGKLIWSADLLAGAANLDHGVCGSPLIDGDRVIVCPPGPNGPALAAFHKDTGKKLWAEGDVRASYGSPTMWEVDGSRQILVSNSKGLAAHDADTGKPLWLFPWSNDYGVNCSQPIPNAAGPGTIFVSTGYAQGGCALIRVKRDGPNRWTTDAAWTGKSILKTKFTSAVLHAGFVFGLDDGILACVDVTTGKLKWKDGRYQHGQVILAGDRLLVQMENGDVALISPNPEGLKELARIKALTGKTWNIPCIAAGKLLVRNDREAVCLEIGK